ncbi:MAG: hypothetical protein KAW46_07490, partial [candidate division Zixibacteria bacterium]|nr:hypothetical protein [candidate division Zixibacteria bacterium]
SRFIDVAFEGNVSFANCTFEGTIFDNVCSNYSTIGCAKLDFTLAKFLGGEVPFRDCSFYASDEILFVDTTFEGRNSPFWMCNLRSELVSFFRASINADRFYLRVCLPEFRLVDHSYLVIDSKGINLANLLANGHFEYGNSEDATGVAPLVSFLRTDFRQMRTATFRDANLTNALFIESVIESVHFINPVWQPGDRRTPILYDKLTVDTDERATDEQLLRLYVQLKRNYEEQRDYSMAGKWFYREMECRRRLVDANTEGSAFVRWLTRNLFRSYKAVSDYGENLVKPFVLLFCLFLLWGPLYFYWGFGIGSETVNYEFACDITLESAKDFVNAIFYSFGIMSFQLTKTAFQHGIVSSLLAVFQILFTLILVPLFLLALRRKFRR